jgi:hypothetical protein
MDIQAVGRRENRVLYPLAFAHGIAKAGQRAVNLYLLVVVQPAVFIGQAKSRPCSLSRLLGILVNRRVNFTSSSTKKSMLRI